MSWREILKAERRGSDSIGQYPHNPQNCHPGLVFEDIEDIGPRGAEGQSPTASSPEAQTQCWPEGSALVIKSDWWPGPPFYIVRTEEEAEALVAEKIPVGIVWTLEEARKLAGLRPEEKFKVAQVKAKFSGDVGRGQAHPRWGEGG